MHKIQAELPDQENKPSKKLSNIPNTQGPRVPLRNISNRPTPLSTSNATQDVKAAKKNQPLQADRKAYKKKGLAPLIRSAYLRSNERLVCSSADKHKDIATSGDSTRCPNFMQMPTYLMPFNRRGSDPNLYNTTMRLDHVVVRRESQEDIWQEAIDELRQELEQ
ncbi:hypothetical protein PROFUN_14983 [Planoprotostelium fungivorum]|uniref:Uncharacterized protein n=1 Tax=Planoprotostelium fungivorum TaxID=1890364 RepID=A0A2P6MY79_9EUKA|nr:hypothetical protein PROFUN_14983 [Planoprotostelium fungivorum]